MYNDHATYTIYKTYHVTLLCDESAWIPGSARSCDLGVHDHVIWECMVM